MAIVSKTSSIGSDSADAQAHTTGNALIVVAAFEAGAGVALAAPTDTAGNTYSVVSQTRLTDFEDVQVAYCMSITGHASNVVTAHWSGGSSDYTELMVYEVSGLATSSPIDGTPGANDNGEVASTSPTTGSTTTANADDFIIAAIKTFGGNDFSSWLSSFTEDFDLDTAGAASRVVSSTGTYSSGATSSSSQQYAARIWAFKIASGSTYTLTATQATLALSGASVSLNLGRTLTATQGALALSGAAVNLNLGQTLTAAQAALALSAASVTLQTDYRLTATQAALALSSSAALNLGLYLAATQAALVLSGASAAVLNFGYSLPTDQAALALSGAAVTLQTDYRLTAAQAALVLSGAASASLNLGLYLGAAQVALVLSGAAVTLQSDYRLTASQAALVLSAASVTLDVSGVFVLPADPAVLVLGAPTIALVLASTLSATQGALVLSGASAGLLYATSLTANQAALALSAAAVTLAVSNPNATLLAEVGQLHLAADAGLSGPPGVGGDSEEHARRGRGRSRRR